MVRCTENSQRLLTSESKFKLQLVHAVYMYMYNYMYMYCMYSNWPIIQSYTVHVHDIQCIILQYTHDV